MLSGTIYAIKSNQTQKYYIGSTLQNIKKRFLDHKGAYSRYLKYPDIQPLYASFEIMKFDDCYIETIEEYKCNTRKELQIREGELQKKNIQDIVNTNISARTQKQYKIDNIVIIKKWRKEYYLKNREKRLRQNRETKKEKQQYYQDNKQKIKERNKIYYHEKKIKKKCLCGSEVYNHNIKNHLTTEKHKRYLESTTQPV
jgi:hypothetical protein